MTEEEYQFIENCGAAEMSVAETAELVGIGVDALLNDHDAVRRYRRGRLTTKFRIRQTVIDLAKNGDPSMTRIYRDIARDSVDLTEFVQGEDSFPALDVSLPGLEEVP